MLSMFIKEEEAAMGFEVEKEKEKEKAASEFIEVIEVLVPEESIIKREN